LKDAGSGFKNVLRSALESYIDGIRRERDLDAPLLALLAAMGFHAIHFTHGTVEFGKDFLAQRTENGATFQYVLQAKSGDIGLAAWRVVRAQLFEAATNTLAHPGFDPKLPRRVVLVTTGRLVGNAPLEAQQFSELLATTLGGSALTTWDREALIELFEKYGPERVHASKGRDDFAAYGEFFRCYGEAFAGTVSERRIEQYSQSWISSRGEPADRVILAVLEAELLAAACAERGLHYAALHATLGAFRAIAAEIHQALPTSPEALVATARASLRSIAERAQTALEQYPDDVLDATRGFGIFATYPVHCSRALDLYALRYALCDTASDRTAIAGALADFIEREVGVRHPISDWYAVSIVVACRVLADAGCSDTARTLVRSVAIWLGDRYENDGLGLAAMDGDEEGELVQILGGPFSAIPVQRQDQSFLATALLDLSCFLGDRELYEAILHDLGACAIFPVYYQPQDTAGQFLVEGRDVIRFPNIEFVLPMPAFDELRHGEHLAGEPEAFVLEALLGPATFFALALLLRDRYFPTLWSHPIGLPAAWSLEPSSKPASSSGRRR
jgi:hypothetical protein